MAKDQPNKPPVGSDEVDYEESENDSDREGFDGERRPLRNSKTSFVK